MSQQLIPLILVVENHWLLGKVRAAHDLRILDLLNESATDYLSLEEVKVFSSFDRNSCLATLPSIVVPKDRLQMAVSPTDRFEIPLVNRIHKIVEKHRVDGSAVAAGYLVQGTLHLNSRTNDAQHILADLLGRFFPITAATIFGLGTEPVKAAAVLTNKDFVSGISCGNAEPASTAQSAAKPAATSSRRLDDSIAVQLLNDGI